MVEIQRMSSRSSCAAGCHGTEMRRLDSFLTPKHVNISRLEMESWMTITGEFVLWVGGLRFLTVASTPRHDDSDRQNGASGNFDITVTIARHHCQDCDMWTLKLRVKGQFNQKESGG